VLSEIRRTNVLAKGDGLGCSTLPSVRLARKERTVYHDSLFNQFAKWTSRTLGHPTIFAAAVLVILAWGVTGPIFGFSNTWQLAINTGTTIVTFLMVFLIQNTQNRDGAAVQLKLDELIRAIDGAHNGLLDLEELSDEDLGRIRGQFEALAREARVNLKRGLGDTGPTELRTD
jgi:low affinity Fe/Cu permease